jgi:hypothetical protein
MDMAAQTSWLCLKAQQHTPQRDLIAVGQCARPVWEHSLSIHQCAIHAIEVFDQHLPALHKDPRVPPPDTLIERTVRTKINIRIKLAHRIAAPDERL